MSSQKVKLVFCKSYVDNPMFDDTFSTNIEIELPPGFEQVHLTAACVYTPKSERPKDLVLPESTNAVATVLDYKNDNDIVGKVLTLADSSFSDKQQREAFKSLARDNLYGYLNHMRTNAEKIIKANERREREGLLAEEPPQIAGSEE